MTREGSAATADASRTSTISTEDGTQIYFVDIPTLILHGDDDQIVPIGASALLSSRLVRGSTLKLYPGLSHGMCTINKDQINSDLLAFIQA